MTNSVEIVSSKSKSWSSWLVRIGITTAALSWILFHVSLHEIKVAMGALSFSRVLSAIGITIFGLFVGALRWRTLLQTYGAENLPNVFRLMHIYLVACFFNRFLPANIAGDVFRGHATRDESLGKGGSYVVVFVERLFGLSGLFLLGAMVLVARPMEQFPHSLLLASLAAIAAAGSVLVVLISKEIGRWMPDQVKAVMMSLPSLKRPLGLAKVLAFSVCTQIVAASAVHVLLVGIEPSAHLSHTLVLIPLALIAEYLPTISGLGTREAAFMVLLGTVGIDKVAATTASLAFFGVQLFVALLGGLIHLAFPLVVDEERTETETDVPSTTTKD